MTTLKEFIEYLKTLPEDNIVSVIDASESYEPIELPLNLNDNVEFCDLTGATWVKPESKHYNKKFLRIGCL